MKDEAEPLQFEQFHGPLALLAGIFGNLEALDAVLAACKAAGAASYLVAGDLVLHGDKPLEVWKRLLEVRAHLVRGASDLALASVDPTRLRALGAAEREALERFVATRAALGELIVARLGRLPDRLHVELRDGRELSLWHGSPADPLQPLTLDLSDEELSALLGTEGSDLVISGGAGVFFERTVGETKVVGLGSVGRAPRGERVAQFALVEPTPEGFSVEPRQVEY